MTTTEQMTTMRVNLSGPDSAVAAGVAGFDVCRGARDGAESASCRGGPADGE